MKRTFHDLQHLIQEMVDDVMLSQAQPCTLDQIMGHHELDRLIDKRLLLVEDNQVGPSRHCDVGL